jgi:hypothetical protein
MSSRSRSNPRVKGLSFFFLGGVFFCVNRRISLVFVVSSNTPGLSKMLAL